MKRLIISFLFIGCAHAQTIMPPVLDAPQYPGQVYIPSQTTNNSGIASGNINIIVQTVTPNPQVNTIITSSGAYQVIPNYTTGRTMAIIQVSKGK